MIKALGENEIVRAVAEEAAKRICRRAVRSLQAIKAELSGDDSGLATVWDEICVQVQSEHWFYWETYDEMVGAVVAGLVHDLLAYEQSALWLQTPAGESWSIDDPEDREPAPFVEESDIVRYLLSEFVYAEAGRWSNQSISAYIDRCGND